MYILVFKSPKESGKMTPLHSEASVLETVTNFSTGKHGDGKISVERILKVLPSGKTFEVALGFADGKLQLMEIPEVDAPKPCILDWRDVDTRKLADELIKRGAKWKSLDGDETATIGTSAMGGNVRYKGPGVILVLNGLQYQE